MDCATARRNLAAAETALSDADKNRFDAFGRLTDLRHQINHASSEVQTRQTAYDAAENVLTGWGEGTTGGEFHNRNEAEEAARRAHAALTQAQDRLAALKSQLDTAVSSADGARDTYNDRKNDRDRCQREVNNCH